MKKLIALVIVAAFITTAVITIAGEKPWEKNKRNRKREQQDAAGGVPKKILDLQSLEKFDVPSVDEAIAEARKAAKKAAEKLIDTEFHKGKTHKVPGDYKTIQAALDAAKSGDIVLAAAGTYYELLVMKDGVKLVSDSSGGGDELVVVKGAKLKLPKRALRTIVDGSKSETSKHGMIDFDPGLGRKSIVDGFTLQNLPKQDHHIPGHAHGLNVRGASPVITNCLIQKNGSTGIGNHVVYNDQESKMPARDFRAANIKHEASAVLYNNIVRNNFGLGIGCNHFSSPQILGNEVYGNDDSDLHGEPSPGMGIKHGAHPVVVGNYVHDNARGGIQAKVGAPQGKYNIDKPTHPTILNNVVTKNGKDMPGISTDGAGSKKMPVVISGNYVYNAGAVGIGITGKAFAIIEDNLVTKSESPGIAVNGATALKLNRNKVIDCDSPGVAIGDHGHVEEMLGNQSMDNDGPRYILMGGGTIADPDKKKPVTTD